MHPCLNIKVKSTNADKCLDKENNVEKEDNWIERLLNHNYEITKRN